MFLVVESKLGFLEVSLFFHSLPFLPLTEDGIVQKAFRVTDRVKAVADRWFNHCREECRCCDCHEVVAPWDEICPNCGRGQPAKVSARAGFVIVVGSAIVLLMAVAVLWVF